MEQPEFKPGDKVKLKSGGPAMTLEGAGGYASGGAWTCEWFDGTDIKVHQFLLTSLELAEDDGDLAVAVASLPKR